MKSQKEHYLHFTKKERRGVAVLLAIVFLLTALFYGIPFLFKKSIPAASLYKKEIAALETNTSDSNNLRPQKFTEGKYYSQARTPFAREDLTATLFYFDPNVLSIAQWQQLGVKEKTATGIRHYIDKGGKFRQATDINKIWGLSETMKMRLEPFIRIAALEKNNAYNKSYIKSDKKPFEKKPVLAFDINAADTSDYISLPGIGSKLAGRIVNFRERLGGFFSVEQVGETFGLPDSTFQKIKPFLQFSGAGIKKININTVTLDELKAHPYIRWQLADIIIRYRLQHGNFLSVSDLRKIMAIKEDIFNKISPYCTAE